jgi:N-alpha-acetyltransferase 30|eukprot:Stramenopile-MAST_4_protein_2410
MSNSAPLFNSPSEGNIKYTQYIDESQIEAIRELISRDLSEPYSIFTYRYFINNWPNLCWLAHINEKLIGVVVNKADRHRNGRLRGYVAMLAVDSEYRKQKIGTKLATLAIEEMRNVGCDEIVLEALISNYGALSLYKRLGFVKDKRLPKYYLNGLDAYRLKLYLSNPRNEETN